IMNFNFSHKIKEAEEHVRQADKYLKTSLTKWKPDLDSAINELEKATTCYRVADAYDKCLEISLRNSELQLKKGSTFFAAKSYEQAATCAQQLNDLTQAAKYFDKAGQLLSEGQRDSAAILYERSAPIFQNFDRSIAIDFYAKGARIAEVDDKTHQASDLYEKAALQSIRVQPQNFPQTSELLEKCSDILAKMERYDRLNRVLLYRILIKLFMDDFVAAKNLFDHFYQEYPTFAEWEETQNIHTLIESFEQDDPDSISQNCQIPFFMAIDNEFVRLLKKWIIPKAKLQDGAAVTSSNSGGDHFRTSQTTTTTSSVKPIQLDDDDDLR
ncbi:unnamed protein product, partial [Didymodactylos carnosus]